MNISVLLAPGWGENAKTLEPLRCMLELQGLPTHSISHARSRVGSRGQIMNSRATDLILAMGCDTGPVTIIGHSLGAIDAVRAAIADSDGRIAHLILVNPAGLITPISMPRLVTRFIRKIVHDRCHQWRNGSGEAFQNLRLAYLEAQAAARGDVRGDVARLLDQGVRVTVLAAKKDPLFPYDEIILGLASLPIDIREISGYHDSIHLEPEAYSELLQSIISPK
jgi:pimeloyl-ACP methyl ester carboxylesterase